MKRPLSLCRYECYEAKEELKEEMSILQRYTPRGILTWNLDFPECTDMDMNTLCTLGKLNPLKISPTFYTKSVTKKE